MSRENAQQFLAELQKNEVQFEKLASMDGAAVTKMADDKGLGCTVDELKKVVIEARKVALSEKALADLAGAQYCCRSCGRDLTVGGVNGFQQRFIVSCTCGTENAFDVGPALPPSQPPDPQPDRVPVFGNVLDALGNALNNGGSGSDGGGGVVGGGGGSGRW